MCCAQPASSALRLAMRTICSDASVATHAMSEPCQVDGVLARAATDIEQVLASRERALEAPPAHLAEHRAEGGRGELRVIALRQSVERRRVDEVTHLPPFFTWHASSAATPPLCARLTHGQRLDVMEILTIQAVVGRSGVGVMTQGLPFAVCQERPQAFAPGAPEYGFLEIRAVRLGERLHAFDRQWCFTRPTRSPARCSKPTSPRIRAVSSTLRP